VKPTRNQQSESIMTFPTAIDREEGSAIRITWDDGTQTRWTPGELRKVCPCATCREKKRKDADAPVKPRVLPVISAAEAKPLTIDGMKPVGNYAYNITFSDGHHSGIFSFPLLKRENVSAPE
jgi:DUF971 family protein